MFAENGWKVMEPAHRHGKNIRLVEDFLASGEACVAKDMGDNRKALSKRNMLMQIVKNNERYASITVAKRGTMVIMVNADAAA